MRKTQFLIPLLLALLLTGCKTIEEDFAKCEFEVYKTLLIAGDKNLPHIIALGEKDKDQNLILICMRSNGYEWDVSFGMDSIKDPKAYRRKWF
ncbi:hypothetical protein [Limnohabitans sp.]|uniref:hypothetical protein n=1 Tax=Limnohabitans sp. TaxID=1907725 RepID=UPI0038BA61F7